MLYVVAQRQCPGPPVTALRPLRLAKGNDHRNTGCTHSAPEGAPQGVITDVAGGQTDLATGLVHELQGHWLHRDVCCNGSLKQIGMKRQQALAVTGGALRKHANHVTGTQAFGHVVNDTHGVPARRPLDKQGPPAGRQRANDRPLLDVCLGDKTAILRRMHRDDVKP